MRIFKNTRIILIGIILLAAILRLHLLGGVPASLNWDEVSLGYNAKSILETGRDEYGDFFPIVLRSFDDYKPALYVYFAIPAIWVFGLTEFSVRLPSALFGILAVSVVYFIVLEILQKRKIELLDREIASKSIALLTAFLLAISPWHIQFSRIAFESNIGLTINLIAFLLFLKGLRRHWYLVPSLAIASLNIHIYQSDRVFTPLLFIALSLIFFKVLLKAKKQFLIASLCAVLIASPFIFYIVTNQNALSRARGVSVFSSQDLVRRSSEKLIFDNETNNALGLILDNRRIEFLKATIAGYIYHFDPNWLFISGDIARHHAPHMGLLYLFEIPFLLIGFYILVFLPIDRKYKAAFFAYFLLVPIPASITSGVPHAVRTLNFLWTFQLMVALGLLTTFVYLNKLYKSNQRIFYALIPGIIIGSLLIVINFTYYLNQYFVQLNYYDAKEWLYGYKHAVTKVDKIRSNYERVVIANQAPFDQSYMFFLFYMDVDSKYYQSLGGTETGGFKEKHRGFYNITFGPINNINEKGTLLVGELSSVPKNARIIELIRYPNGEPAIAIAEL